MTLKDRLAQYKKQQEDSSESDWMIYKKRWVQDVHHLYDQICDEWLGEFKADELMTFSRKAVSRTEANFGEYFIDKLDIDVVGEKYLTIQPIAGVTTGYHGKLEFQMLGNIFKKATILRELEEDGYMEWWVTPSQHNVYNKPQTELQRFGQKELIDLLEAWL